MPQTALAARHCTTLPHRGRKAVVPTHHAGRRRRGGGGAGIVVVLGESRSHFSEQPRSDGSRRGVRRVRRQDRSRHEGLRNTRRGGRRLGRRPATRKGLRGTNVDHPTPVDGDTVFRIGSTTKTFTGTTMMRLVDQGKVDLDAPVRRYLPDFAVADPAVPRRRNCAPVA